MTPSASILVVNFNSGRHIETCIDSLKAQTLESFEVIILDNASSDGSPGRAKTTIGDDARFQLIEETRNLGFAKGNNQAAEYARADWIITLNPDAFPEPEWLENLVSAARAHPQIVHFGSTQYLASEPDSLDGAGDRYFAAGIPWRDRSTRRIESARAEGRDTFEIFAACAAAAMYRADVLRALGGFDERFFCFIEDVDLGFRLRLLGHPCIQVISAAVKHVGGGAGGGESEVSSYYGARNLIWCFAKNMPLPLLLLLIPVHVAAVLALVINAGLNGRGRATLSGINNGLRGLGMMLGDRRKIDRRVGTWEIACAMSWNPAAFLRRRNHG